MSRILSAIQSDLRRTLLSVPGVSATRMKFEGRRYDPAQHGGEPYVAERVDPVSSRAASAGYGGSVEERMIYAVDVMRPQGEDLQHGRNLADAIRQAFHPGRTVSATSGETLMFGRVSLSELGSILEGDGWNRFPVRVTLYVRRPTMMDATY